MAWPFLRICIKDLPQYISIMSKYVIRWIEGFMKSSEFLTVWFEVKWDLGVGIYCRKIYTFRLSEHSDFETEGPVIEELENQPYAKTKNLLAFDYPLSLSGTANEKVSWSTYTLLLYSLVSHTLVLRKRWKIIVVLTKPQFFFLKNILCTFKYVPYVTLNLLTHLNLVLK